MSVTIGDYTFDGPYTSPDHLEDRSGVYAVLCRSTLVNNLKVIDIGESAQVRTRLQNHDRAPCWAQNCTGTLVFAAYYTPNLQQAGRMKIEQELRKKYSPPCGDR